MKINFFFLKSIICFLLGKTRQLNHLSTKFEKNSFISRQGKLTVGQLETILNEAKAFREVQKFKISKNF